MATAPLRWPLHVTRCVRDEVTVFAVSGRLGTVSSGDLIETIAGAVRQGARRIVLDLTGVDYLSSAGLLALDAILGRVHSVHGDLVLCGLTEPVRVAFELSGLLPHFTEAPSPDDAVAALSQTADSGQQTADSRQQTADSRQQTADSRQRTAESGEPTEP